MISVRPETSAISASERSEKESNCLGGTVSFTYYIGNTMRYDVEMAPDLIFKVDVENPRYHELYPMGKKVYVSFPVKNALGITLSSSSRQEAVSQYEKINFLDRGGGGRVEKISSGNLYPFETRRPKA